jgi:hypothetical protein
MGEPEINDHGPGHSCEFCKEPVPDPAWAAVSDQVAAAAGG